MIRKDSARAVLADERGRILLVQEKRNGPFGLPGGKPESTETPFDAAVREFREETGLTVVLKQLIGVIIEIPTANGDNVEDIVFTAERVAGDIVLSRGHPTVDYFARKQIESMDAHGRLRNPRVMAALDDYWHGVRYPLEVITVLSPEHTA